MRQTQREVGGSALTNIGQQHKAGPPLIVTLEEYMDLPQDFDYDDYDAANRETFMDIEEDGYENDALANPPVQRGAPPPPAKKSVDKRKADPDYVCVESDSEEELYSRPAAAKKAKGRGAMTTRSRGKPSAHKQTYQIVSPPPQQSWQHHQPTYTYQQEDGSVHYVHAVPMDVAAQTSATSSAYDIKNFIDFQYQ